MEKKIVPEYICKRITQLIDEINNNDLPRELRKAKEEEIIMYRDNARESGEYFPEYIERGF